MALELLDWRADTATMKLLRIPLLVVLGLLLTACQSDDSAPSKVSTVHEPMYIANYVNTVATTTIADMIKEGITPRVHATTEGEPGVIVSQLPLPGDPYDGDTTIDLVISGTEADVRTLYDDTVRKLKATERASAEEKAMDALRTEEDAHYTIGDKDLSQANVDDLDEILAKATPKGEAAPAISDADKAAAKVEDIKDVSDAGKDRPELADNATVALTDPSQLTDEDVPTLVVGDPDGPAKFSDKQAFTGPTSVKVGRYSVVFPGPTAPLSQDVQGMTMTGHATRLEDGRVLTMGCTSVARKDNSSFGAAVVDQILMYAPLRYGTPIRTGRTAILSSPGVSTVADTEGGYVRVVTWYGYGQICDITLPVNKSAASDKPVFDLLQNMVISS